jgi:mRNA interferase RelE/StbE
MSTFTITLSKNVVKQLDKLSNNIAQPIFDAITLLADEPRPKGCKKLKGREGYRIRVGKYRIIYEIYDKVLLIDVLAIGHRKDIY